MITKLPGSKWFIETDDVTFEIIGTYNKAFINADITAIQNTLLSYPSETQDATDIAAVLVLIDKTTWTDARKKRTTNLVNEMYQSYQGDTKVLEAAQLQAKLDGLIALKERLV